jgi:Fe-S-cluster containining protein
MKLKVLASEKTWYAEGLEFTCTQCGNCCTGGPGFVWITREEIVKLAELLQISPEETVERYCHKVGGQFSLREQRNAQGQYDCIFLREEPAAKSSGVSHSKRVCGVYSARPLQCRTWPFWSGNLISRADWDAAAVRCHGMNRGKHYSAEQIEALSEAKEWPTRSPGAK